MKTFDFRLWFAFLLISLIPATLNLIRLHFIGNMPNEWGFNIASQIQWLNISYEVIQEAFLIPLFFMLANAQKHGETHFHRNAAQGFTLISGVYLFLSVLIFVFAEHLLAHLKQTPHLIADTSVYIRLESVAIMCSIATEYLIVYLAVNRNYKDIILFSIIKTALLLVSDCLLVADNRFSLQMGVNGIAVSNILINGLLTLFLIFKTNMFPFFQRNNWVWDKAWFKQWFHLGAFSGLESFVRNAVFALMILRMVNEVGEQGAYWIANSIIWGFLLAPALALSEVVKRDVAADVNHIRTHTSFYLKLTALFCAVWLLSMPFWAWFVQYAVQTDQSQTVVKIMCLQTVFYLSFMFNHSVFDATLKGLGLTRYMLYQSIWIDIVYYGLVFALYYFDAVKINLISISLIFGIGMLLDMIPTWYLYQRALRAHGLKFADCFHKK